MRLSMLREDSLDPNQEPEDVQDEPQAQEAPQEPAKAPEVGNTHLNAIKRAVQSNDLVLVGRKPSGAMFTITGLDGINRQITQMVDRHQAMTGMGTMQDQYDQLAENVELLVSGKSSKKSMLLAGAPRSGKTFNVLKTLEKMGLVRDKDFFVVKGKTTDAAVYEILIAHYNDLLVFDDCDSVADSKDGANMLKAALDSTEPREVSSRTTTLLKTDMLTAHEREDYTEALSAVLRARETEDDILVIESTLQRMKLIPRILRNFEKEKRMEAKANKEEVGDDFVSSAGTRSEVILDYARNHLPNLFEFKGRIIFISNLELDEWDSAVVGRSIRQNMNFASSEMLDFIEKICPKMDANLSLDEKLEVIHYLRELHQSGSLKIAINFGTVQEGWDIRQTPNWKKKIARW